MCCREQALISKLRAKQPQKSLKTNTCLREGKTKGGPKKNRGCNKIVTSTTIETKIGHVRTSQWKYTIMKNGFITTGDGKIYFGP